MSANQGDMEREWYSHLGPGMMLEKFSRATDRDAREQMVCLVSLVCLVEPEQPEEPNKPNKPDRASNGALHKLAVSFTGIHTFATLA
jgi:hypothetical protein